jgi:hypothetical protein
MITIEVIEAAAVEATTAMMMAETSVEAATGGGAAADVAHTGGRFAASASRRWT